VRVSGENQRLKSLFALPTDRREPSVVLLSLLITYRVSLNVALEVVVVGALQKNGQSFTRPSLSNLVVKTATNSSLFFCGRLG